jgi:GAF domain-containing protein
MSILTAFNPYTLPETVQRKNPLAIQREIILQYLLNLLAFFGVLRLILFMLPAPFDRNNLPQFIPFVVCFVVLLVVTLARRLPYTLRALTLVILIMLESLDSLLRAGLSGTGLIYALAFVAAVAVLFGPRAAFISIAGVAITQLILVWLMISGRIVLPKIDDIANSSLLSYSINSVLAILLSATSIVGAFVQLTQSLLSAAKEQKTLTDELLKEHQLLESRVLERTMELSRKTVQLEAAREVASTFAGETDTDLLLKTTVEAIKEKFGFYQVNIFLNDDLNGYTVLHASTGEVGQRLLENAYRVKVGETGIVGFVAGNGKARIARNVEGDPNYILDPNLPNTRAELAVPLFARGDIAGVLDIQSNEANAFLVDDIDILTSLAGQISQAIENARLLADLRHTLTDLENSNLQATQASWNTHLKSSKRGFAFRFRQARIEQSAANTPESLQALNHGVTVVSSVPSGPQATQPYASLAIPIKIRNQTLGVINMRVAGGRVSQDLIELVEGAVNRLSAALENARLLEEIQARSERERLVGEIASKVRTANDIDSILRTAAGELGRSLDVSEVVIQLDTTK